MEPTSSLGVSQFVSFLKAAGLGALLAFYFDLYRAFSSQIKRHLPGLILFAADCLFWVIAALSCIAFVIFLMWGEIYFYSYLGLAAGFGLYLLTISRILLPFWHQVFAAVLRGLTRLVDATGRMARALVAPICWMERQLAVVAGRIAPAFKDLTSRIFHGAWRSK